MPPQQAYCLVVLASVCCCLVVSTAAAKANTTAHTQADPDPAALPPAADWMTQCCSHKRLRQLYLPGTHDSSTYAWTTPKRMPAVLDEVLTILFNIVGDLSRTQQLDVYQQLQAGARVLDIRLAVNPWIAVQARQQQQHLDLASAATTSSRSLVTRAAAAACAVLHQFSQQQQPVRHHNITPLLTHPGGEKQPPLQLFQLDPVSLQGAINMSAAGGPLTVSERRGCIVGSHSLPGAPLLHMLRDIRRFLAENPGELVVLLVKADTIDVNVAGSLRMTAEDWATAAEVFSQELRGVQLVDEQQVQALTLGQLAAASTGGGSVLLYSSQLQTQGLVAVESNKGLILESWFNGTNTEDVGQLKQHIVDWLLFWRSANWREQNRKPFLLLASAEVTLGVKTILGMVKNRIWRWQQAEAAMQQQQQQQHLQEQSAQAQLRTRRALLLQQHTKPSSSSFQHFMHSIAQQQQPLPPQLVASTAPDSLLASGLTTLYQLGVETNKLMMEAVLGNSEVPKEFTVWGMDAISADIANMIISLNSPTSPTL